VGVPKFVLFEALFQILVTEMDNRMHMVDFFLHARMEMGTRRGTQTTINDGFYDIVVWIPPAMPPIRIRHPKGVSTIEVVLDSPEFTVQDLQQEIYAAAGVLPSRQIRVCFYIDERI